jgi:hypothetical protein
VSGSRNGVVFGAQPTGLRCILVSKSLLKSTSELSKRHLVWHVANRLTLHFGLQVLVEYHLRAAAVVSLFQLVAYPGSLPKTIGPTYWSRMLTNRHCGMPFSFNLILQSSSQHGTSFRHHAFFSNQCMSFTPILQSNRSMGCVVRGDCVADTRAQQRRPGCIVAPVREHDTEQLGVFRYCTCAPCIGSKSTCERPYDTRGILFWRNILFGEINCTQET